VSTLLQFIWFIIPNLTITVIKYAVICTSYYLYLTPFAKCLTDFRPYCEGVYSEMLILVITDIE